MGFRYFSSLSGERDKYITLRKDRFPKCKQSGRDAGGRRGLGGGWADSKREVILVSPAPLQLAGFL